MAVKKAALKKVTKDESGYSELKSNFPESWNFNLNPVLSGSVIDMKTVPVKRGKKIDDVRLLLVETMDGDVCVWESAALTRLFDLENVIGTRIRLVYKGEIDIKGQKQPMHDIRIYVKK